MCLRSYHITISQQFMLFLLTPQRAQAVPTVRPTLCTLHTSLGPLTLIVILSRCALMTAQVGAPYPRVPSQAHMAASGQLLPGSAPFHAVVSEGAPPLLQMDGGAAATMGAMGAMGAAAVDKMSAAAFMVQQQQMTGGGGNGFLLQRN